MPSGSSIHLVSRLGVALCLGVLLSFPPACARDAMKAENRQFDGRVRSVLGVSLPCSLAWCDKYLDGGSIGGTLIGAAGDTLKWAWDGAGRRMPTPPASILHDRVLHHAITVNIRGNSYRLKDKLKAGLVQATEAAS